MRDEGVGFTFSCTLHTFPIPSFLSAMIHAAPNASAFSPAHKGGFSRCAARFRRLDARFPLIPPTPFSHKGRRARWIETALRRYTRHNRHSSRRRGWEKRTLERGGACAEPAEPRLHRTSKCTQAGSVTPCPAWIAPRSMTPPR